MLPGIEEFQPRVLFARSLTRMNMKRPLQLLLQIFSSPRTVPRSQRRVTPKNAAPELFQLWSTVRREYFPDRPELDQYLVTWSRRRQRRTLASCHVRRKEVHVAKELRDPLFTKHLPALLYHEMCHAALGEEVGYHKGKRAWHGPRFRALEQRHPGISELDAWIRAGGWAYAVRRSRGIESRRKVVARIGGKAA